MVRAVPWLTLLAAEVPDLDVFVRRIPGLAWVGHRGISHSLVAAPFIALAVALVIKLCFRRTRLTTLFPLALGTLLVAHLLPDVITYRGIRPLLPWSQWRLTYPLIPLVDPFVILPLAAVLLVGWIRPLWRRRAGVAGLAWMGLYLGYRALLFFL